MSAPPTFYIFHGEDLLSRRQALARMRAQMGDNGDLNRSEFDGTQTPVPEVLAAVKSYPFLADKRLVIVTGLIRHITRRGAGQAGKTATDRLLDELPRLPAYARLALVENETLPAGNRLLKAAQKMPNGYVRVFPKPRNLSRWLTTRAKNEYAAEISPQAADAIAAVAGDDLLRADNELYKLVAYVDGQRPIDEQDVAALTPYVPEANVFELVDALATGNGARALELMQQSLRNDPRDPGFRLYALIVRQFRLLLMTRDHLDRGGGASPDAIAQAVGARPFAARKLAVQAWRFSSEELTVILKRLQRYDQEMKTGRIAPRLVLDLLVTNLARD